MDKFVCVRLVQANRLDMTRFQFDYDLTFAMFFMNADGTIYGRYGTRTSRKEAERELSAIGLAESMKAALALHEQYPKNKSLLLGKQARPTKYKTPNDFPMLRGKYKTAINYQADTARSCLHCHQVSAAELSVYRDANKPIPDKLIFQYPMPDAVGLTLDPKTRATVSRVAVDSPAHRAGFRAGDEIITLDGQAILSIADVQWVLHHTGDAATLPALVRRKGGDDTGGRLTMSLPKGWRHKTDIEWRITNWPLRRMGLGGIILASLSDGERKRAGLEDDQLGLRIDKMGRYGPHATARRVGFREGDIIVSFNGRSEAMARFPFLAMTVQTTKPGQRVPVVVLRNGKQVKLTLPMQK